MSKAKASKVRFLACPNEPKDNVCFTDVNWNGLSVEATGASANGKYWGMGLKSGGGGPFIVHPHDKPKRFARDKWTFMSHTGKITDSMFHPFNDDLVLTGSQDCTMKLWKIPKGGLTAHIKDPLLTLEGHSKRILFCKFHPAASNIVASAAATNQNEVKLWDISTGEELRGFDDELHPKAITDIAWNYDGTFLATANKDKKVRVFDPRSNDVAAKFSAYDSLRPTKLCFMGNETVLTTGFAGGGSGRQAKVWDMRNPKKYLSRTRIDNGTSPLYPVYDSGTNTILMTSKGSTSVKTFEYSPSDKSLTFCNTSSFKEQCRGFGMVPKRDLDVEGVEVFRMMWIGADIVQPLTFNIPRKTRGFIPEFFPDDYIGAPSMTAKEYMSGSNTPALTGSLDPSKRVDVSSNATFVVAKTRKEIEAELAAALKTIAMLEATKIECLRSLGEKGIEPAALDLSTLPPPPPEPVRAAPAPAPVPAPAAVPAPAPAPASKQAQPEPKMEPVKKKKKKKGPLISTPPTEFKAPSADAEDAALEDLIDDVADPAPVKPKQKRKTRKELADEIVEALGEMSYNEVKKLHAKVCS